MFGRGSRRLGLITAPGQRAAEDVKDYWPGTDFCCIYLVGVHFCLVYLSRDQRHLRMSIPPI